MSWGGGLERRRVVHAGRSRTLGRAPLLSVVLRRRNVWRRDFGGDRRSPWGLGSDADELKPVPVGVGGMPLDAWRTMLPREIAERIAEYRALAARLTAFEAEARRAILTRAVSGSVRDALAVADILSEDGDLFDDGQDPDSDLRWAWTAIAALGVIRGGVGYADRDVARQSIAGRLLEYASDMKLLNETRRDAVRAMRLAAAWAADIKWVHGLSLVDRDEHYIKLANVGLAAVRAATEAAKKVEAAKAEADKAKPADGGAMVVVKSIDPGGNKSEDKALIKSWEILTKPVQRATGPDPDTLGSVLRAEFPWMGEAIDATCGDLRLRRDAGRPWAYWRPVLLVGPAGSGKTRFARRLAELMGTGFGEVCVAGSSDNRMLAGTARGWSSATPSYILQIIRREMANPTIFVDEIDKAVADGRNGDVRNTLLGMLEPLSAKSWTDECLVGQCDLSGVNWILACNDVSKVRGPLLTRLRVLDAPAPNADHFGVVLASIRRDLSAELGVAIDSLPALMPEAEAKLLSGFKRGISLRRVRAAVEGAIKASGGIASAVRH